MPKSSPTVFFFVLEFTFSPKSFDTACLLRISVKLRSSAGQSFCCFGSRSPLAYVQHAAAPPKLPLVLFKGTGPPPGLLHSSHTAGVLASFIGYCFFFSCQRTAVSWNRRAASFQATKAAATITDKTPPPLLPLWRSSQPWFAPASAGLGETPLPPPPSFLYLETLAFPPLGCRRRASGGSSPRTRDSTPLPLEGASSSGAHTLREGWWRRCEFLACLSHLGCDAMAAAPALSRFSRRSLVPPLVTSSTVTGLAGRTQTVPSSCRPSRLCPSVLCTFPRYTR